MQPLSQNLDKKVQLFDLNLSVGTGFPAGQKKKSYNRLVLKHPPKFLGQKQTSPAQILYIFPSIKILFLKNYYLVNKHSWKNCKFSNKR